MYDYKIRLVLLGNICVGKTSFANKLCNYRYSPLYESTVGVDYFAKTIRLNNNMMKYQIWDTTGQKKFAPILQSYYKNVAGFIFVFDLNNIKSFKDLNFWLNELYEINPNHHLYCKLLIGNKTKNNNTVSHTDIDKFCVKYNFLYTEIDIKNDKHIENYLIPFFNTIDINKEKYEGIHTFKNSKLEDKSYDDDNNYERTTCCCWSF